MSKDAKPMVDITDRYSRVEFVGNVLATPQDNLPAWSRKQHHDDRIRADGSSSPNGRALKLLDLGHGWYGIQAHGSEDICEVPLTNIKSRLRSVREPKPAAKPEPKAEADGKDGGL
jgi:hypothetical protein